MMHSGSDAETPDNYCELLLRERSLIVRPHWVDKRPSVGQSTRLPNGVSCHRKTQAQTLLNVKLN